MSPKTGLNNKENNMETNNQLNNEKLNQNSTVNQIKLDNGLKFKLNFKIKDQLIIILNEFTSLLYSEENKEKIIDKANNLMHNLIDLPLKLDHIEENKIDSNNQILKPTLIINSKFKTEIIDLLIKNKNYSILFKDNKDDELNLINENNNLVIKLIQLPVQMLKVDDTISNDFVWKKVLINESNSTVLNNQLDKLKSDKLINELKEKISILEADQLAAKSESDKEIIELKEKNTILKDQLAAKSELDKLENKLKEKISIPKELSIKQRESVRFYYEFKDFENILYCRKIPC